MVIIHCFLNNVVINVDIELVVTSSYWRHHITSDCVVSHASYIGYELVVFSVLSKRKDMIVKKHLIGQTVIVPYMENTDSDILGLGITSLLFSHGKAMWISNRWSHHSSVGQVIILNPTGVKFSNVSMQNKRHESRTTSDTCQTCDSIRNHE